MRIKKIKNAKEKIEASEYLILEPEKYKNNWDKLFGNDNEIRIEIGCGKGNFITEMANQNPNINFIGIEMFDSVLLRAIEKQEELKLKNLKFDNNWIQKDSYNATNSPYFTSDYNTAVNLYKELQAKSQSK